MNNFKKEKTLQVNYEWLCITINEYLKKDNIDTKKIQYMQSLKNKDFIETKDINFKLLNSKDLRRIFTLTNYIDFDNKKEMETFLKDNNDMIINYVRNNNRLYLKLVKVTEDIICNEYAKMRCNYNVKISYLQTIINKYNNKLLQTHNFFIKYNLKGNKIITTQYLRELIKEYEKTTNQKINYSLKNVQTEIPF